MCRDASEQLQYGEDLLNFIFFVKWKEEFSWIAEFFLDGTITVICRFSSNSMSGLASYVLLAIKVLAATDTAELLLPVYPLSAQAIRDTATAFPIAYAIV